MSPLGLHRVLEPAGVLPQAAWRLDARPEIWPDEVRVAVERLNLDAASFRQLREASDGDPAAVRDLIIERREWAEAKVQRYERLRNRILDGLSEEEFLATAPRVGPYLTLMRGISFEEENLRWAKRALAIVEQRQGAGSVR